MAQWGGNADVLTEALCKHSVMLQRQQELPLCPHTPSQSQGLRASCRAHGHWDPAVEAPHLPTSANKAAFTVLGLFVEKYLHTAVTNAIAKGNENHQSLFS